MDNKKDIRAKKAKNKLLEMKKIIRDPILLTTIILVIISLMLFIIWPLYDILKQSFITDDGAFTFEFYKLALTNNQNRKVLINTLVLGLFVSAVATLVAFIFAYANSFLKIRFKKLFSIVSLMPIVSPPFALAMAFIMMFGQNGFITKQILHITNSNIYGFKGLAVVQILTFFPVAYLILVGTLNQFDKSMEEASRNMGATRGQVFRTIVLPLAKPAIVNSFLLVFIQSIADFGNAMVIGGNYTTLAVQVYLESMGNYNIQGGAALASVLLSISIFMFALQKYWLSGKSYVTVTGKPSRRTSLITEKHITIPMQTICLIISIFIIALYVLIPIGSFVKLWGIDFTPTLKNYRYIFSLGTKCIRDTTILSLIAMPITGVLGMVIAFLIVRKKFIGKGAIEFVSMLAMAIPGTVIGLGYLLAYNNYPLMLAGTSIIIIISFIFRSMPVGIRSGMVSLQQIDPAIEEAAQDLGANTFKVFTTVTLPLIKSAFFNGLIYCFVRSMTALSTVIFLVSAKHNLMTVEIMSEVDMGKFGIATGYSTILIIIVMLVAYLMKFILSKVGIKTGNIGQ